MNFTVRNSSSKHKSKCSCERAIYFDLDTKVIKENCKFAFYYNKTDITPTVLDGGNEIILANWPNDKHIICSINNDIPFRIANHLYVLIYRSVLCNCSIEAENNFLLESLPACHDTNSKLVMYFIVNIAFVNYLDQIDNLIEIINVPILKNKTTFKQTLPISLKASKLDLELLIASKTLKDFIHQYNCKKDIFDLTERHENMDKNLPNRSFLSVNVIVDVFLFVTAIISLLVTTLAIYLLCKHMKLRMLVTSTANKRSRGINYTGRCHYSMYMQNSV